MKDKIVVYKNDNKFYLNGFDYANVFHVDMGIDSKIRYYEININELKSIIDDESIIYKDMTRDQKALIGTKYYSEKEDRINRIKRCSDYDLYEWRRQIMHDISLGHGDSSLLVDIDDEIAQRKKYQGSNNELRKRLLGPLKTLADELKNPDFDREIVENQINDLKTIYESFLEKESVNRK